MKKRNTEQAEEHEEEEHRTGCALADSGPEHLIRSDPEQLACDTLSSVGAKNNRGTVSLSEQIIFL